MHSYAKRFVFLSAAVLVSISVASADSVYDTRLTFNNYYSQTGNSTPTLSKQIFETDALFNVGSSGGTITAGTTTTASQTYPLAPGGSGVVYYSATVSGYSGYPAGTYTIATNNGQTTNLSYGGTPLFSSAIPTISNFTSLQGMNPNQSFTIDFNSFVGAAGTNSDSTLFTIYSATGAVFSAGFLSPSTTSITIPAGTLSPNTLYETDFIFDDRVQGTSNSIGTEEIFDQRNDSLFTTGTAVPEPSFGLATACLLALMLAAGRYMRITKVR